jgi:hypothetical protein
MFNRATTSKKDLFSHPVTCGRSFKSFWLVFQLFLPLNYSTWILKENNLALHDFSSNPFMKKSFPNIYP